jgi:hypothetical protein
LLIKRGDSNGESETLFWEDRQLRTIRVQRDKWARHKNA